VGFAAMFSGNQNVYPKIKRSFGAAKLEGMGSFIGEGIFNAAAAQES
jgi:hypothetical protein